MEIGRKSVRSVSADREPASRIQQKSKIRMQGRKPDSIHRRVFIASELPVVRQRDLIALALLQAARKGNFHRKILSIAGGRKRRPMLIDRFGNVQRVVELESCVIR